VSGWGLVLLLAGFASLTLGGWLGGSIVFVHGIRVLDRPRSRTRDAANPNPKEVRR
jgi:uncharacterized membrane protein